MSVKVQNLLKIYGSQRALDGVSFEAQKGQVLGFLGPNGAGKTTTMKIVTGYLPATEGRAEVCGLDVAEKSLEARRRIGYLPEHNPLYKEMFVKEYLAFVAGLHDLRKPSARIAEMIALTGLEREQNKPISALSKGYRQRVGLAQAMIHDPEVLILDEPTTGLDPNQLVEIRALIRDLGREKTVIFSTHVMQEVQAVCDRVVIIDRGKIVADSHIAELQNSVSSRTVVTVEFLENVEKVLLEKIKNARSVKSVGKNRWQVSAATENDLRAEIFHFSVAQKLTLLEMKKETLGVEDVFQQLTKSN